MATSTCATGASGAGTGAVGAAGAAGPTEVGQPPDQHHLKDAMNYLVQPIPGFGNFMGRQHVDEKKEGTENKKKHDDVSVAVYQVSLSLSFSLSHAHSEA
jgi:hypothetical protein